ncbi:MAG: ferritin-like domain-containing protein, partial [Polyangia bacterium]
DHGRAHLLNQAADAEGNGENGFFEHILAHVDDPALQKMITKHRDDELRHEQLFLAARDKTGLDVGPVPNELKLIDRLDRAVGHFFDHPIRDRRDIMQAYLMLQVIEERALTQFALFELAFRPVDPETADVIRGIADDEERHLKYCHAIARRYAPDERTQRDTLRELRELEARAFAENGRANMDHLFDRGWVAINPVEKFFWKAVNGISARSAPPLTEFASMEVA